MTEEPVTRRVAQAAHEFIDESAEKAESLERQFRDTTTTASDKVDLGKELTQQQIEESYEKVERFIREQPVATAGIAFAAGLIVSSLLRR